MREKAKQKSSVTTGRTAKSARGMLAFPTHDEITLRARELYEKSGYPGGRDVAFWLEAERQLRLELNT